MKATTQRIIDEIEQAVADGSHISPATFTAYFPRANVSAAFRVARKQGIIVVDSPSCAGTPIYRKALRITEGGGA